MGVKLPWVKKFEAASKDESGSMSFFVAIMFITMIGVAGIAIDIARFEASRTEIQSHLDNCTLAAASLRHKKSPSAVLDECMSASGVQAKYTITPTNEIDNVTYRRLDATGELSLNTMFMKMFGVKDLGLLVSSAAEERIPHVEVSMVLDISGSMNGARLNSLIPAAQGFVETILAANDVDNPYRASLSLVPYNMQVNAGQALFNEVFTGTLEHQESFCAEWSGSGFYQSGFSPEYMDQSIHMSYSNDSGTPLGSLDYPYCRTEDDMQIMPLSSNVEALKLQIGNLEARGNTSIDIGVKWGLALLDPSSQSVVEALASQWQINQETEEFDLDPITGAKIALDRQAIEPGFIGRPVSYDDDYSFNYRSGSAWNQLGWTEAWSRVPLRTYNQNTGTRWWNYWDYNLGNSAKNTRLSAICAEARANEVTVFTIAYSATPNGNIAMRDCSGNDDSKHFNADTDDISGVFSEIAGVIEKLKLVQ